MTTTIVRDPRKFLWIFAIVWTLGVGAIFAFVLYGVIHQYRALSFLQTTATIDSIKITESHGNDNATTYGIDISYHYTVNGKPYTSTRLRYFAGSSSDNWAHDMLHRFPRGAHVPVYYDPSHPEQAVLIRGLEGFDLFILLFLTPFVVSGLGIWTAAASSSPHRRGFVGLSVRERPPITRLRPSSLLIAVPCITLTVSSFISLFPVAFLFGGFHPSLTVATNAWLIVLSLTSLAALVTPFFILSGRYDVILDDARQVFRYHRDPEIPYAGILHIALATETRTNEGSATVGYEVWLHYTRDQRPGRLKLKPWSNNLDQAQRLATWFSLRLNAPLEGLAASEAALPAQK